MPTTPPLVTLVLTIHVVAYSHSETKYLSTKVFQYVGLLKYT